MRHVAVAIGIFAAMTFLLSLWAGMTGGPQDVGDWAFVALMAGTTVATCVLVLGEAGREAGCAVREP